MRETLASRAQLLLGWIRSRAVSPQHLLIRRSLTLDTLPVVGLTVWTHFSRLRLQCGERLSCYSPTHVMPSSHGSTESVPEQPSALDRIHHWCVCRSRCYGIGWLRSLVIQVAASMHQLADRSGLDMGESYRPGMRAQKRSNGFLTFFRFLNLLKNLTR
jgi:hypothetical protein